MLLTRAGSTLADPNGWQRYFLDIAGVEFLEGPVLFILASFGVHGRAAQSRWRCVTRAIAVLVMLVSSRWVPPGRRTRRGPVPQS